MSENSEKVSPLRPELPQDSKEIKFGESISPFSEKPEFDDNTLFPQATEALFFSPMFKSIELGFQGLGRVEVGLAEHAETQKGGEESTDSPNEVRRLKVSVVIAHLNEKQMEEGRDVMCFIDTPTGKYYSYSYSSEEETSRFEKWVDLDAEKEHGVVPFNFTDIKNMTLSFSRDSA